MAFVMDSPERAGTNGSVGTFPIGKKVIGGTDADGQYEQQLGDVIHGERGSKFLLVRLNLAAGLTAAEAAGKAFAKTSQDGWDVAPIVNTTGRSCGTTTSNQVALADNDYFWLEHSGVLEVIHSDDAVAIALGDFVGPDGNAGADNGKVKTTTVTYTAGVTIGIAVRAAAAAGDRALVQTLHDLNG